MPKVGDVIDLKTLQARWAYSEITSSRFGSEYAKHYPQHAGLISKVKQGAMFEHAQLSQPEIDALAQMNDWYRPGLVPLYGNTRILLVKHGRRNNSVGPSRFRYSIRGGRVEMCPTRHLSPARGS